MQALQQKSIGKISYINVCTKGQYADANIHTILMLTKWIFQLNTISINKSTTNTHLNQLRIWVILNMTLHALQAYDSGYICIRQTLN